MNKYCAICAKIDNGVALTYKHFTAFTDKQKREIIRACELFNFPYGVGEWKFCALTF